MFAVYENGKSADYQGALASFKNKNLGWDNSKFDTFDEARKYALNYFYPYIQKGFTSCGIIEYNEGCFAEIREE